MHDSIISWKNFQCLSFAWIAVAVLVFVLLLFVTAPYGRHSSNKWGPLVNNKLGWVIMEMPVLVVLFVLLVPSVSSISIVSWIMIGLFAFHYFNRIFIFPFRLHTKGKKMPLLIVLSGVFFNLLNGSSLGYYFAHFARYDNNWLTDARFIIGFGLFLIGLYINWKADNILIHFRKPGETHYVMPKQWLFKFISCPNLFGELIEWLGFAVLCWNLPAFSFFIWTVANLVPRALSHHDWYKKNFEDYPVERKAVVPFVL